MLLPLPNQSSSNPKEITVINTREVIRMSARSCLKISRCDVCFGEQWTRGGTSAKAITSTKLRIGVSRLATDRRTVCLRRASVNHWNIPVTEYSHYYTLLLYVLVCRLNWFNLFLWGLKRTGFLGYCKETLKLRSANFVQFILQYKFVRFRSVGG